MPENMTKKRKAAAARKARRRRRQRRQLMLTSLFLLVCVGAFASLSLLNRSTPDRAEAQQWYVADGEMQILAAPAASTLDNRASAADTLDNRTSAADTLPFLAATAEPTARPSAEPTAEPESTAEPQGMHFFSAVAPPEESAAPMEALAPEATLAPGDAEITITAVGDCTLGGDIPTGAYKSFASYYDKYGPDYFFANVRELFASDDLTIVNLEGPLTTSEKIRGRKFNFRGLPEYVSILSGSSVEICNVANNHALDFGMDGLLETADVLESADIGVSGFGRMYYTDVKGVRVGSLGFTEWDFTQKQIETAVRTARENCDLLIVSIHWGEEGSHTATSAQKRLGRAIVDAGADVVLGTHSHVYGGVELYNGKYIVYSLGNFCFGGNRNPRDKDCMIFQQTFRLSADGAVEDAGINLIPARVSSSDSTNDFQPKILGAEAGQKLLNKIGKVSSVNPASVLWMSDSYPTRVLSAAQEG